MDQDPCGFNRNKRKLEDEILEVRVAKHTCLCLDVSTSAKGSNSFSEDADSVMSMSELHNGSSSSSVNWSGETKPCSASTFPTSEDCEISSLESETKHSMQDFFCSNAVLSSGRWNVNQDAEQATEKLTIDKEFEQYFSMLML